MCWKCKTYTVFQKLGMKNVYNIYFIINFSTLCIPNDNMSDTLGKIKYIDDSCILKHYY